MSAWEKLEEEAEDAFWRRERQGCRTASTRERRGGCEVDISIGGAATAGRRVVSASLEGKDCPLQTIDDRSFSSSLL
jgi:hypothetical protein